MTGNAFARFAPGERNDQAVEHTASTGDGCGAHLSPLADLAKLEMGAGVAGRVTGRMPLSHSFAASQ